MNVLGALVVWMYSIGYSESADSNCNHGSNSARARLRSKLFCDYDKDVRPVSNHTNTTDVGFLLFPRSFILFETLNTLTIDSWAFWSWTDAKLVWNPDKFDSLHDVRVLESDIWMPDVILLMSATVRNVSLNAFEARCKLRWTGDVYCNTKFKHSAYCSAEISRWPFDTHNCTMMLGERDRLNITMGQDQRYWLNPKDKYPNRKWKLLSIGASQMDQTTLAYSFNIKRYSTGDVATVIIPSLILAMLTLAVFWVKPRSTERMCLIYLDLLCHCLYLQYLGAHLPSNGDKYPVILLFFRDSLLLASVSLIVTLVVKRLDAATDPPPSWITTVTDVVLATLLVGRVLMSGDVENKTHNAQDNDVAPLVQTSSEEQGWHLFAVLLDRTFFLISFLTTFILLCAFLP